MNILLTGPFGNVGLSTLKALFETNHKIRCFDIKNSPHFPRNKKIAGKFRDKIEIIWGDIRNKDDVKKAVEGQDAILHLAAIISPLADSHPELGTEVNVGGTANIVHAVDEVFKNDKKPKLIYTSSVAVYGDVRGKVPPLIRVIDPLPEPIDEYSRQKIAAEKIVINSGLKWSILRLSFVFSTGHMELDPLMFHVPLDTLMEPVYTEDAGIAITNAATCDEILGKTVNIAGGSTCRTNYREFMARMMNIFGLGMLPDEAFSKDSFHMGYMDTEDSQSLLRYQQTSMDDMYQKAREEKKFLALIAKATKPIGRRFLLSKSEFYRKNRER